MSTGISMWLVGIALGAIFSALVGIVLFACWIECFVRNYGQSQWHAEG